MLDMLFTTQRPYRRKKIPFLSKKHKKKYIAMLAKDWPRNRKIEEEADLRKYMPIAKYVCVNCGEGPYARDDDAPDDDAQQKAKDNALVCDRPFSKLSPWRPGTGKGTSFRHGTKFFRWWWAHADDNVLTLTAFETWKLEVQKKRPDSATKPEKAMPSTDSLSKPKDTLDLPRATPAYMRSTQKCCVYVCVPCSSALGLVNNLDPSGTKVSPTNPTYCPGCYAQATQNDLLEVEEEKKRRAAALAYKLARPDRGLVSTCEINMPEPHEIITDFRINNLWAKGKGLGLIKKTPSKKTTYTRTEVNALLSTVMNSQINSFFDVQTPYTLVMAAEPKYHVLTVAECKHHFGEDIVKLVKESGYQDHKGKFVYKTEVAKIDPDAESDDPELSDRELSD